MNQTPKNNNPVKNYRVLIAIVFMAVSMIFSACRKDISLPDPSLDKLFGSWEWVETSGGYAGQIKTPATEGYSKTIEFKSNGIYKVYIDGKRDGKMTFTIKEGTSILTNASAWFIDYDIISTVNYKIEPATHTFHFGGQDTLFLSEDFFDGFNYVYVRK
jgi:hypothetical protein